MTTTEKAEEDKGDQQMERAKESQFKFKDIKVTELNFKCCQELGEGEHEMNIYRRVRINDIPIDKDPLTIVKKVALDLEIRETQGRAEVSASIEGLFQSTERDPEKAEPFFRQNAPALLLSYLRPILSLTLNNSYFPIEIPFLNFAREEMTKQTKSN